VQVLYFKFLPYFLLSIQCLLTPNFFIFFAKEVTASSRKRFPNNFTAGQQLVTCKCHHCEYADSWGKGEYGSCLAKDGSSLYSQLEIFECTCCDESGDHGGPKAWSHPTPGSRPSAPPAIMLWEHEEVTWKHPRAVDMLDGLLTTIILSFLGCQKNLTSSDPASIPCYLKRSQAMRLTPWLTVRRSRRSASRALSHRMVDKNRCTPFWQRHTFSYYFVAVFISTDIF